MKMVVSTNDVLQYFYVGWMLVVPAFCGLERTCTPSVKSQGPQGTCGSQLTEIISLACMFRGGYNTNGFKRSAERIKISDQSEKDLAAFQSQATSNKATKAFTHFKQHFKQQLVSKRQAMSFLVKKSAYNEQGIVCECCYHRCSFREIMDYCQGDDFDYFKRSSSPEKRSYVENIMNDYYSKDTREDDEHNFAASEELKDNTKAPYQIKTDMH